MAFDSLLGLLMDGGRQLAPIPPNASSDDQIAAINDIIAALNNLSRDIVASGTQDLNLTGSTIQTLVIPHNLGYAPKAYVYLNKTNLSDTDGNTYPNVNIPLPTWVSYTIGGGNITYKIGLSYFTDNENLYIRVDNGPGSITSSPFHLSYALTRDVASLS